MDSEPSSFVKCACVHCQGHLEFERAYAGARIACPHCGQEIVLTLPDVPHIPAIVGNMRSAPPTPAPAAPPPKPPPEPDTPPGSPGAPLHLPRASKPCYAPGGEVRIGDRVRFKGVMGTVVFVSDGDHCECAPGYDEYRGADAGVVICDDDGSTTSISETDARLELVHH